MKVQVHAEGRARVACPIWVPWTDNEVPGAFQGGPGVTAAQRDGDRVALIVSVRRPDEDEVYTPCGDELAEEVKVSDTGDCIEIILRNEEFTVYRYRNVPARPYFWPVLAPGGISVTRAWPMRDDVPGETRDHKHHRSLYFAFGDVNGVDNWSEEAGHGHTVHRSVDEVVSGPVFGRFRTTSDWTDARGAKVLEQKATVTVWNIPGDVVRMMDVELLLEATEGEVVFGDTKEGGLLTVRVATPMDVPRGGRIENAYGGVNERETWGYAAHWCDYSGVVDGHHVGIAVMDHPLSFRYPTYWHVRDYGLMAANPFALSAYTQGAKDGTYRLSAGESLRFLYRVIVHRGDASAADIRSRYLDFVSPPRVSLGT